MNDTEKPRKLRITYDGYDYRVPPPDRSEAGASYHPALEDARDTARHMYKDPRLEIYLKRVDEHPKGVEEGGRMPTSGDFAFKPGPKP